MRVPPNSRVIVVVVSQPGCGACEDFAPRLAPVANSFVRAGIPTLHVNAQTDDAKAIAFMDRNSVSATPTVLVLLIGWFDRLRVPMDAKRWVLDDHGHAVAVQGATWKFEGSTDDATIKQIYDFAYAQALRA